jgi:uncharacterized protein
MEVSNGVKIDIRQIPPEGLILVEEFAPRSLDLETDIIRFHGPIKARAEISKITNTIRANVALYALMYATCSRCLGEFEIDYKKNVELNYPVGKTESVVELDADIREEIILDYEVKPLCNPNCKGLCPKCGKNLNEGGCSCGST